MEQDQLTSHVQTLARLMDQGHRDDWRAKTPVWRYDHSTLGADIQAVAMRLGIEQDEAMRVLDKFCREKYITIIAYEFAPTINDVLRPTPVTNTPSEKPEQGDSKECCRDPDARPEADYVDVFEKIESPVDHGTVYAGMSETSSQPIKNDSDESVGTVGNVSDWFMEVFGPALVSFQSFQPIKSGDVGSSRVVNLRRFLQCDESCESSQPIKMAHRKPDGINVTVDITSSAGSKADARVAALMNMLTTKRGA